MSWPRHFATHGAYERALRILSVALLIADADTSPRGRLVRRTNALVHFDRRVTGRAYLP